MSSFRRTSDVLFSHTWRDASSWATQAVARAGSSTTQQHKSISSQNVQNLMNASFLDLRNTRQHHPQIKPKAEPPVICSQDEDEGGDQANSASLPEPHTFKQAIHGDQADGWREAAKLEYSHTQVQHLWLLHIDLLVEIPIREGGCDLHRTKFKVFNCSHGHNNTECGRTDGRRKAFIVVESWTLRVSLCDDSGLEVLNRTI